MGAERVAYCERSSGEEDNVKNSVSWLAVLSVVAVVASCEVSPQTPVVQAESSDLTGPTITLHAGSGTQSGYDFHAQTYQGNSGGDFYFSGGAFWANNVGQRGVVDVGANCPALAVSAMPTSGYGLQNVPAVAGHCYVGLTKGDTRDFVVFRVSTASSAVVSLVWNLATSGDSGVTLTNTIQGYEFSSKRYLGASGGDFYFSSGSLWANNYDQRGIVALGACPSVESAPAPPATGYNKNGVAVSTGNCYAAIMRYDPRHRIVFHVDHADASSAALTWRLLPVPLNQLAWQHCDPYSQPSPNNTGVPANILASWLSQHPAIETAMQWMQPVVGTPTTVGYTSWPATLQAMLSTNFVAYWNWYNSGMTGADPNPGSDPPANTAPSSYTALSDADAQSLYVKYVALTLVVEIQGRVPWTITNYDSASLAELLDARKFFTEYNSTGYALMQLTVVPAPPLVTAQFVAQNNFLCANRPATIAEAVFWARNLEHEYGNTSPADNLNFWQYAGAPPASRVLAGTKYTGTANVVTDLRHWTNGCHGTTGLLKMLLRALNVPVEHFSFENPSVTLPQDAFYSSSTHAVPHFLADGLWMSHGDDPYFLTSFELVNVQLPFPVQAMLITDAQFFAWFPNPGTLTGTTNIGQQADEIRIHYGDAAMLSKRLNDLQTTPPTDQNLCAYINMAIPPNNVYSCAQAEQMGLLSVLDPLVQPYVANNLLLADLAQVPTYVPPLPQTLGLLDPSFIDGLSGWTTAGIAAMGTSGGYGDTSSLVLGATSPTNGDSTATQTFTAPPGSTGISLWFKESCPDSVSRLGDGHPDRLERERSGDHAASEDLRHERMDSADVAYHRRAQLHADAHQPRRRLPHGPHVHAFRQRGLHQRGDARERDRQWGLRGGALGVDDVGGVGRSRRGRVSRRDVAAAGEHRANERGFVGVAIVRCSQCDDELELLVQDDVSGHGDL